MPDGEPCEIAEQCASGWCWSDWDDDEQGPGPKLRKADCIEPWDQGAFCSSADDCCGMNFCFSQGQESGFCDEEG